MLGCGGWGVAPQHLVALRALRQLLARVRARVLLELPRREESLAAAFVLALERPLARVLLPHVKRLLRAVREATPAVELQRTPRQS